MVDITLEEARTYFHYDPITGLLTWKSPTARTVKPGDEAGGTSKKSGVRTVYVHDQPIQIRRLIWLIAYAELPSGPVGVRNGDNADMRLENLFVMQPKWSSHKREIKRKEGRLLSMWARTNRDYPETGWESMAHFSESVDDIPPQCHLVPIDADKPIGPNNFKIEPRARHDRKTREGRVAYYTHKNEQNKDKRRASELAIKFGLTPDQFHEMLIRQKGVCAVCGQPETASRNGRQLQLSIDHCHQSGSIRALLCSRCNRGIGYLADNPETLRAAAAYVDRHASKFKSSAPASNIVHLKTKQER